MNNVNVNSFVHLFFSTENYSTSLVNIISVNATDCDTGDNGKIKYSLVTPPVGFLIGEYDGVLKANLSTLSTYLPEDVEITVKASDFGNPSLYSFASVRVQINTASERSGQASKRDYR